MTSATLWIRGSGVTSQGSACSTRGHDFESEVVAQLLELHPDALTVAQRTPQNTAERNQETLLAIRDGVPLILGGRLPADPVGRRVGEPDLLVAAAGTGRPTSPCLWPSRKPLPPLHRAHWTGTNPQVINQICARICARDARRAPRAVSACRRRVVPAPPRAAPTGGSPRWREGSNLHTDRACRGSRTSIPGPMHKACCVLIAA